MGHQIETEGINLVNIPRAGAYYTKCKCSEHDAVTRCTCKKDDRCAHNPAVSTCQRPSYPIRRIQTMHPSTTCVRSLALAVAHTGRGCLSLHMYFLIVSRSFPEYMGVVMYPERKHTWVPERDHDRRTQCAARHQCRPSGYPSPPPVCLGRRRYALRARLWLLLGC